MDLFAKRLRERAKELGLSHAEIARRIGLGERRFGHYAQGIREPDLTTLLKISTVLGLTPNDLLLDNRERPTVQAVWKARLAAAAERLSISDLKVAVRQVEALADRGHSDA